MASMFASYSEVRSNTSMAMESSLRLSISPSSVRFTMCVRKRHSRTEATNPGLFTTRANWSRTAVAGTGSAPELARDVPNDEGGVSTCLSPTHYAPEASQCYGDLTAAYGRLEGTSRSVASGRFRERWRPTEQ